MDTQSERLKWARQKRGYDFGRATARQFGWNENTYKAHEQGRNGFDFEQAKVYGRAFHVDALWLMTGEGTAWTHVSVELWGFIENGGLITPDLFNNDEMRGPVAHINLNVSMSYLSTAYEVKTESLWPRYESGDILLCGRESILYSDMAGHEVIAQLEDGRLFLRKIVVLSDNSISLQAHNSPPLDNVKIVGASAVDCVVRRGRWYAEHLEKETQRLKAVKVQPTLEL